MSLHGQDMGVTVQQELGHIVRLALPAVITSCSTMAMTATDQVRLRYNWTGYLGLAPCISSIWDAHIQFGSIF
jgi:hypothetical protein